MTRYRIFPPIGIARLGEDPDFFLGPEAPDTGSTELLPEGAQTPVGRYKDATRRKLRKQGARFRIFQSEDGVDWNPAALPPAATVTWRVTLVNKKSAVIRTFPSPTPVRPVLMAGGATLVIDGGTAEISGPGAASGPLRGTYHMPVPGGPPSDVPVELGQLRTDAAGNLIVLGGSAFSSGPPGDPLGPSFYRNPGWHDDVADGPVTAEITLSAGSAPVPVDGSWVITAPPDYAPGVQCVVTLYDVLRQLGITEFDLPDPGLPGAPQPSFDRDVEPILRRVRRLRWVHVHAPWADPRLTDPGLRSTDAAETGLRDAVRGIVEQVESFLSDFELRDFQRGVLERWVKGDFDATPAAPDTAITAAGLTRAALEATAGQGFFPGIEGGILLLDPTLYSTPFDFRIDHTQVAAGDLTALMAQPWQADFLKCSGSWWPSQRPDIAPQGGGAPALRWTRGADTSHEALREHSAQLGLIVQQGPAEVFLEVERDPTLPPP